MEKQIEEMAELIEEVGEYTITGVSDCFIKTKLGSFGAARKLYEAGYRKQEWISVEERLPNEYERVIGCVTEKVSTPVSGECYRVGNKFHFPTLGYNRPISYWMPLPEPPKGE